MSYKRAYWVLTSFIMMEGILSSIGLGTLARGLVELSLILWFFNVVHRNRYRVKAPGIWVLLTYVASISVSALYNQEKLVEILLYSRYFLYGWMTIYISYSISDIKSSIDFYLKSMYWIVTSQIIAACIVFLVIGRIERIVGTMSSSGGSLATVWPLALAPLFFIQYSLKSSKRDLAMIVGLLFIGFVSGKRGVYFLVPINILITYIFLMWRHDMRLRFAGGQMIYFALFLIGALMFGIANTESIAGTGDLNLSVFNSAMKYAEEYSFNTHVVTGESIGRSSSTISMLEKLELSFNSFFGNGLGVLKGEIGFSEYGIGYGVTGFIREVVSVGLIGACFYVLFYLKFFRLVLKVRNRQLRFSSLKGFTVLVAFSLSTFFSIIIVFFGYSRVLVQSLNPLFFLMFAVGLTLNYAKNGIRKA